MLSEIFSVHFSSRWNEWNWNWICWPADWILKIRYFSKDEKTTEISQNRDFSIVPSNSCLNERFSYSYIANEISDLFLARAIYIFKSQPYCTNYHGVHQHYRSWDSAQRHHLLQFHPLELLQIRDVDPMMTRNSVQLRCFHSFSMKFFHINFSSHFYHNNWKLLIISC